MPRLPKKVKNSLTKARESALLAVEIYNKPAVSFRSGGYIVLMIIAWTAFFHAYFFRKKIKPFFREKNRRTYKRVNGEYWYWDLEKCLKEYFGTDTANPIRKNLEFFIPLRNIIEHKSLPEIDSDIFAECQSMLLNFDELLEKNFGVQYCIRESLSFSLQLFPSTKNLVDAVIANPDAKTAVDFINSYRSSITTEILKSGKYSFKAFLVQVANHQRKNTLPVQFVQYDKLSDQEKRNVERVAALVKKVPVPIVNADLIKPGKVVEMVQLGLGGVKVERNGKLVDKFSMGTHTLCWKKYKVRPENGSDNPSHTKTEHCIYDNLNKGYGYTEAWVDFLIEKISDENEYNSLYLSTVDD